MTTKANAILSLLFFTLLLFIPKNVPSLQQWICCLEFPAAELLAVTSSPHETALIAVTFIGLCHLLFSYFEITKLLKGTVHIFF